VSTDAADQAALAQQRYRIRHSAAHVMADAITSIWPQAKLTIGPPTDDGFYYDIDLDHHITPEDLKEVERRMRKIIGANNPFVREEISREDARRRFAENQYKLENIDEIPEGEAITTYSHGGFTDLCEGPHVERAGAIKAVKLLNVAGAYWRGDCVEVKPGVPHSLRRGVEVIEFQTPVYERLILAASQPVQTQNHWDSAAAAEAMHLTPQPPPCPASAESHQALATTPTFNVTRHLLGKGAALSLPAWCVGWIVHGGLRAHETTFASRRAFLTPNATTIAAARNTEVLIAKEAGTP